MLKNSIKRILISIPVLIGVVLVVFIMLHVIPGDPIANMMKEHVKMDVIERMRKDMGLDDPLAVQFLRYIKNALHGDFGISYKLNRPVSAVIWNAFPNTVRLACCAAAVAWAIGIPAGILSAIKKNTAVDRLFMGTALLGVSMPVFLAALILQYAFSYKLHLLPVSGYETWQQMILPSVVLGWSSAGTIARLTRSNLLEVLQEDYIRTARAKGMSEARVIIGHGLKNSMLPVVTVMAIQISGLLSGAVITESIFCIPGIGGLAVDAINNRDMPLLQGTVLFTAVLIIAGNLIADILYSVIDPRIRTGE